MWFIVLAPSSGIWEDLSNTALLLPLQKQKHISLCKLHGPQMLRKESIITFATVGFFFMTNLEFIDYQIAASKNVPFSQGGKRTGHIIALKCCLHNFSPRRKWEVSNHILHCFSVQTFKEEKTLQYVLPGRSQQCSLPKLWEAKFGKILLIILQG